MLNDRSDNLRGFKQYPNDRSALVALDQAKSKIKGETLLAYEG